MHVLMTADTIGGVWTFARELVTQLSRQGIRITLVSFGEIPSAQQSKWLDDLPLVSYYPTAFRLEWMLRAICRTSSISHRGNEARSTSFQSVLLWEP